MVTVPPCLPAPGSEGDQTHMADTVSPVRWSLNAQDEIPDFPDVWETAAGLTSVAEGQHTVCIDLLAL